MLMAMALSFTACHDDNWLPSVDSKGTLSLKSLGIEVSDAENVVGDNSRASHDLSNFIIKIYNNQDVQVASWVYSSMPEVFTLDAGDYTIKVYSHEQEPAAWDKPYYYGTKSFTIVKNDITNIGVVTCKFSNIHVSVEYSDQLKALLGDDVTVTVKCGDATGGELVYTPTETREGYFKPLTGTNTLIATFHGTVDGHVEELQKVFTDIEAGQHRIITFVVKTGDGTIPDETGNIEAGDGITIDATINDEDVDGSVSGEEGTLPGDRPGEGKDPSSGDDGQGGSGSTETNLITITSDNVVFGTDTYNTVTETMKVVVDIAAEKGIQNMYVYITSDVEAFMTTLGQVGMPTEFDLANTGDKTEVYTGFSLPVDDQVKNQTALTIDLSQLVPLLKLYPCGANEYHTFTLKVVDNDNNQLTKVLRFKS